MNVACGTHLQIRCAHCSERDEKLLRKDMRTMLCTAREKRICVFADIFFSILKDFKIKSEGTHVYLYTHVYLRRI